MYISKENAQETHSTSSNQGPVHNAGICIELSDLSLRCLAKERQILPIKGKSTPAYTFEGLPL